MSQAVEELLSKQARIKLRHLDTVYVKGQVLWCGAGEAAQAAQLFASLLESPELDDDTRRLVEADFTAAAAGEVCR